MTARLLSQLIGKIHACWYMLCLISLLPQILNHFISFLGLASYYWHFVPQFSAIASPLFALTRKDASFEWSPQCEQGFCKLKKQMSTAVLLAFSDFSRGFILKTDVSGERLGAVLAQKADNDHVHPIAYASRALQPNEKNYSVTEMEAFGVVWAVRRIRHYVYGHKCVVFTDRKALKSLLKTPPESLPDEEWFCRN